MTYGQVKNEALRLIWSYSVDGEPAGPEYNNQADYIAAIPGLVDACQMLIATGKCRIPAVVPLRELTAGREGPFDVYRLPEDFWSWEGAGLLQPGEDARGEAALVPFGGGQLLGGDRLVLPAGTSGLVLSYWRYPQSLGGAPEDARELDNRPQVHAAIPYYVAAHLVLYDDPYRYKALLEEFESKLDRLREPLSVREENTADVYGGFQAGEGAEL